MSAVLSALSALAADSDAAPLLVAVSGGVDSMSLAHGLAALDRPLALAHVHHSLRGAEADADRDFVREQARRLGVPFRSRRVDPRARRASASASRSRPTLQEAARRLRYDALRGVARELGARTVATAHTLDDQAETVLLRLLRGTGPDGLGGIPETAPLGPGVRVVRPLLAVSRAEVLEFARARGVEWREDPTNDSPAYARNRLRHEWLPGLSEAFNPRLLRAIGNLAEAQRRESEWLEQQLDLEARRRFTREAAGGLCIVPDGWSELPEALARRLARRALHCCGAGREVSRVHLERMLEFLRRGRPGQRIELPSGLVLTRDSRGFQLGEGRLCSRYAC